MDNELLRRVEALESHVAHLERQYEQLNDIVIEQGRELGMARSRLKRVARTLETIELERIKSTDPKPPHYR